jgi:hypothetical protein
MYRLRTPILGALSARASRAIQLARPHARASLALPAVALPVLATALAAPGAAQSKLVVSTSANLAASSTHGDVDDASLVRVESGGTPFAHLSEGHWQAVAGRVPGDVDALGRRPGLDPATHRALAFSLQADEGGFQDGDVLALAAGGGFEVVVSEDDLVTALASPASGFDVDALCWDDAGLLLFSLQANLASSTLGPIADGDVLRLEADGTVSLVFAEADVQSAFTAATGSTSSVGDVLALEHEAGEVWVVTQSPSSADGGVLVLGAAPRMEYEEADLGLGGAELDALMVLDPAADGGRLEFSAHAASSGDAVTARLDGGDPFAMHLVLFAGNAGYTSTETIATGFGGVFVDLADPWLLSLPTVVITLDGAGAYSQLLELPPGLTGGVGFQGEDGWTFQTIDVATLEVSAPFRIQL